jgi:hypothetical protein
MHSVLARIIAVAACVPLISGLWSFVDLAQRTYRWDGLAVPRETFSLLSDGLVTPIFLFGVAAIVEMLFRIAQRTPASTEVRPVSRKSQAWPWRSAVANLLLVAAALTAIGGVWSTFDFVRATAALPDTPPGQLPSMIIRGCVDALIDALFVVGLAAVVENLGRIAKARPNNEKAQ